MAPINIHIKPATIILMILPNIQTRNMAYQHLVTYCDETVLKQLYINTDDEVLMLNFSLVSRHLYLIIKAPGY